MLSWSLSCIVQVPAVATTFDMAYAAVVPQNPFVRPSASVASQVGVNTRYAFDASICAARFSPIQSDVIGVVLSQFYGIVGTGALCLVRTTPNGTIETLSRLDFKECCFDVSWHSADPGLVAVALGGGSVALVRSGNGNGPVDKRLFVAESLNSHRAECSALAWNKVFGSTLTTTSWDGTCCLWDISNHSSARLISSTRVGNGNLYDCVWSAMSPTVLATPSADGNCYLLDTKSGAIAGQSRSKGEVLTVDWSSTAFHLYATGSTDGVVSIWDCRNTASPVSTLTGIHSLPVRRVKFDIRNPHVIYTASYDLSATACQWNSFRQPRVIRRLRHHSEFVTGLDVNQKHPGQILTAGWDRYLTLCTVDVGAAHNLDLTGSNCSKF